MDESKFHGLAAKLVLAVMRSAEPEKIGALQWWPRAKSALHSGAARATCFEEMVSIMGRKIGIDVFSESSALDIRAISVAIDDWELFRHLCERDALYVVADAQSIRAMQKAKKQKEGTDGTQDR